jgi:hypothetical protein
MAAEAEVVVAGQIQQGRGVAVIWGSSGRSQAVGGLQLGAFTGLEGTQAAAAGGGQTLQLLTQPPAPEGCAGLDR